MLRVRVPPGYERERAYAVDVVLAEFLGLRYELQVHQRPDVEIGRDGDPGGVAMPDIFFACAREDWLTPRSMPAPPVPASVVLPDALSWAGGPPDIATPFAAPGSDVALHRREGDLSRLEIDVFGTAFFMLTRYEEVIAPARDAHGRHRAECSFTGRAGVIRRPIVSELVEVLWRALQLRWPGLERRSRRFRAILTHDVDVPFCVLGQPRRRIARQLGGDVLRRRDPQLAMRRVRSVERTRRLGAAGDLCNTFEWIMGLSERHGLRSAFFFIPGRTGGAIDGNYRLDGAAGGLMRAMGARGHEVGIHPSYGTFRDGAALRRELAVLRRVAEAAGLDQDRWGGRQHYLRWEAPTTWQIWADAGLSYDSTVGYAEAPGFRAGVCWEYPAFNVRSGERLPLRERPLVVMETSLFDPQYLALAHDEAARCVEELLAQCRLYGGDFVLLWHNDNLISRADRELYARIVETVSAA
jgi:hypothetical protein